MPRRAGCGRLPLRQLAQARRYSRRGEFAARIRMAKIQWSPSLEVFSLYNALMNHLFEANEVIRQAESRLRQLLLDCAERADYETARTLIEWANQLKGMVEQNCSLGTKPRPTQPANEWAKSPFELKPSSGASDNRSDARMVKARQFSQGRKAKAAKREYPKFFRDGEQLLKVGWSKRARKTYHHKAPKRVVLLACQALQQAGADGRRLVMEQVLPIHDPQHETDIPSYQAYVVVAWLRKERLIVQHGRQGYSLPPNVNLTDAVEERWNMLATC